MPLLSLPHPGTTARDSVKAVGWTITQCACQLGVTRNTLSRLQNEYIGISPAMALALERIDWCNANHWMHLQVAYDLAQERLRQTRHEVRKQRESIWETGIIRERQQGCFGVEAKRRHIRVNYYGG